MEKYQPDGTRQKVSEDVANLVKADRNGKGSMLAESYREVERRGKAFTVDTSKIDASKQDTYKRAMEAGVLNNTNATHDFVDLVAALEAERGVKIDFANNQKLRESGFAVGNATVNGVYADGRITLNVNSAKSLNSVVGHEITHVLEGTELYTELQTALFEYAKSKGEYDSRLEALNELYKSIGGADVNAELTADLVGDYLFTDEKFIKSLTAHKNLFQRLFDEIKYMLKIASAGSNEAKQLERVKRAFEKAFEDTKGKTETKGDAKKKDGKTQLSMSTKEKGNIDIYGEREYNNFGWAREEGAVTKNELDDMYSKIHIKGSLKNFPQSTNGEAIIEVNDDPYNLGTDNVFAFVVGTKNNPQITKVVRFEAETEAEMDIIKEKLYERGSFSNTYYSYLREEGLAREYSKARAISYNEYAQKARRGSSGAESSPAYGNRGSEQNRSGIVTETKSNDIAPIKETSSADGVFFDAQFNDDVQYSIGGRGNGYDGYSMSNNARAAYENGEKPWSKWTKSELLDAVKAIDESRYDLAKKMTVEQLRASVLNTTSWHHTSKYYNKTDFYSINEDKIQYIGRHMDYVNGKYGLYEDSNAAFDRETRSWVYDGEPIEYVESGRVKKDVKYSLTGVNKDGEQFSVSATKNLTNSGEKSIIDIYTTTDDFVKEVAYNDRHLFARSLANKTSGMQEGEMKAVTIYGSKIYFFMADGYMHGKMYDVLPSNIEEDVLTQKREEFINGIDRNAETFDSWSSRIQSGGQGRQSYFAYDGYEAEASGIDGLYGEESGSNTERYSAESGRHQYTGEEIENLITRLKTLYGLNTEETSSKDGVFFDGEQKQKYSLSPSGENLGPVRADAQKTADVLTDEPRIENKKASGFSLFRTHVLDDASVFEDLSLKTGNRELQGKFNAIKSAPKRAQHFIGNGTKGVKSMQSIKDEVDSKGKTTEFSEYMYHAHNIDRMSMESEGNRAKRLIIRKQFKGLTDKQIEGIAAEYIRKKMPKALKDRIMAAREYVKLNQHRNKPVFGDGVTAKDSEKAAKNGYTIKAFHGTGYDFTVFDKLKQGINYDDWGKLGKGISDANLPFYGYSVSAARRSTARIFV